MINRTGVTNEVVIENGGSFVAANKEFKEEVVQLEKQRLQKRTSFNKENGVEIHRMLFILDTFHSSYQQANSRNALPLPPNHFLFGQVGDQFAPKVEERICYGVKKR